VWRAGGRRAAIDGRVGPAASGSDRCEGVDAESSQESAGVGVVITTRGGERRKRRPKG